MLAIYTPLSSACSITHRRPLLLFLISASLAAVTSAHLLRADEPVAEPRIKAAKKSAAEIREAWNEVERRAKSAAGKSDDKASPSGFVRELAADQKMITGLELTADGKLGISAGWDGVVHIWNLTEGREQAAVTTPSPQLYSLALSPDGKLAVAGGRDGLHAVDLAKGELLPKFAGSRSGVDAATFSPDGKTLITGARQHVELWNVESGMLAKSLEVQTEFINAVDITAVGEVLCVGGYGSNTAAATTYHVRLWNIESGQNLFRLDDKIRSAYREGFLIDADKSIVLVNPGGLMTQLDVATGKETKRLAANVTCAAVSPDGKTLVSGDHMGQLRMWDLADGRMLRHYILPEGGAERIAVGNDRSLFVAARDKKLRHIRTTDFGTPPPSPLEPPTSLIPFSVAKPKLRLPGHKSYIYSVTVSPDGKRLASGGFDRSLKLWDLESGLLLKNRESDLGRHIVNDIAYLPDGKHLLLACGESMQNFEVVLWDIDKWQAIKAFDGHTRGPTCVAVTRDGKTAATGSYDTNILLWDVATGKMLHKLTGHTNAVRDVEFSADGSTLASSGQDHATRIWDVASGRETHRLQTGMAMSLAFSPTKAELLLGSGQTYSPATVWDYEKGQMLRNYGGHSRPIWGVRYSPDGTLIATAATDGRAQLLDTDTGKAVFIVPTSRQISQAAIAFTPDARRFITVGPEHTIEVWDVPRRAPATQNESQPDAPKPSAQR